MNRSRSCGVKVFVMGGAMKENLIFLGGWKGILEMKRNIKHQRNKETIQTRNKILK